MYAGCSLPQRRQLPLRWNVVADTDCKLLSLDFQTLVEMFASDVDECLQRAFMVFGLNQVPFLAGLAATQKLLLASAMEVENYKPGELLTGDVQFALVFDGTLLVHRNDALEEELGHGERYINSTLFSPQDEAERMYEESEDEAPEAAIQLVAGELGLTVGTLAGKRAAQAFKELGVSPVLSAEETTDIALEVLQAHRVSVLRHLSCKQIERLVKQLVPRVYVHDTFIFEQGEIGTAFYIVASGQVQVIIDGKPVRTLARHGHFGERALLFEEPRTATVRVLSSEAELWCLEKAAFVEVLTENLREEIMRRIEIQDSNVELQDLTHVRVIGIGGFGHVRLVEDRVTGLRYALKQVKKVDGQVPPHVRGECELLAEMDHPFILDVMNTYETSSSFYILMEYIMGGTLRHVIKEMQKPFERSEARFYVGSLILVLEVLHDRNIVYRDLKPENVMVDSRGYVKLIDFGIAKRLDEDGRTFTCIGSPHYMAPEAILSRREGYGTEVDTWALGILLYELVCGCQPFGDAVKEKQEVFEAVLKQALMFPASYNDECGKDLLQAMLDKSPENRLGAGVFGWDDIKEHEYFVHTDKGNLFDDIVERLLLPPYLPAGEFSCDEVPQEVSMNKWKAEKTIARTRTRQLRRPATFATFTSK
ncbi:cGMP-dependent protein kinase (TgPKG) [Durusdinium trenchii]|uniref:cGMP-dependent protein kinase n=2 Tax=Durusdinium trenchii TaxID=1381693 RepID=A0ABP0NER5_9DINO